MSEKLPVSLFVRLAAANMVGMASGLLAAYLAAKAVPDAPLLVLFILFGVVGLLVGFKVARRIA